MDFELAFEVEGGCSVKSAMKELLFVMVLSFIIFFNLYFVFDRDIESSLMSSVAFSVVFGSYPFVKRKIDEMSK
ncbi:hypothetical protein [Metasolibacillus fluoroglycofenilyticus]|uniref:hypothetical protein n=1 Tax=Metasolibacillus fluoroglycofenilyticus TaxID=1239396 RepID=UPI000D3B9000|nr:hypothetical protein [Metasolibacillus fluoroglycofenilyticus]